MAPSKLDAVNVHVGSRLLVSDAFSDFGLAVRPIGRALRSGGAGLRGLNALPGVEGGGLMPPGTAMAAERAAQPVNTRETTRPPTWAAAKMAWR